MLPKREMDEKIHISQRATLEWSRTGKIQPVAARQTLTVRNTCLSHSALLWHCPDTWHTTRLHPSRIPQHSSLLSSPFLFFIRHAWHIQIQKPSLQLNPTSANTQTDQLLKTFPIPLSLVTLQCYQGPAHPSDMSRGQAQRGSCAPSSKNPPTPQPHVTAAPNTIKSHLRSTQLQRIRKRRLPLLQKKKGEERRPGLGIIKNFKNKQKIFGKAFNHCPDKGKL